MTGFDTDDARHGKPIAPSATTPSATTPSTSAAGAPAAPWDPRPALSTAFDTAAGVISSISADQHALPTPCTDMRVEQLVGHLIGVIERISVMAKGGSVDDVPFILELDPTEWNTAYQQRAVDARASWADVALLTTPINLPWAVLPGFAAVSMYVNEVTVHSWDLAVATGQRPTWDESVADLAYQFMQQGLPAEERHDAPFDDAVDVPASASSIDRLVAWNGRQPGWKA